MSCPEERQVSEMTFVVRPPTKPCLTDHESTGKVLPKVRDNLSSSGRGFDQTNNVVYLQWGAHSRSLLLLLLLLRPLQIIIITHTTK
jgi:hypothetical protein